MRIGIIIPTYNESENIQKVINLVFEFAPRESEVDVIIVDDNSPDGTSNIVRNMMKSNTHIKLIQRQGKLGLASAYLETMMLLLEKDEYDALGTMDADLSHNPINIKAMSESLATCDVAVGSRYISGGKTENWPLKRKFLSYFGNMYARTILGLPIKDITSGFLLIRSDFLKKIQLSRITCKGFAFLIELKYLFYLKGAEFKEIAIVFVDRQMGPSKISGSIINEGIVLPLKLRLHREKYKES